MRSPLQHGGQQRHRYPPWQSWPPGGRQGHQHHPGDSLGGTVLTLGVVWGSGLPQGQPTLTREALKGGVMAALEPQPTGRGHQLREDGGRLLIVL